MPHAAGERASPPRALVVAAFAILYVVWGSTYLAIRYAVETMPPLLMAGTRFLAAGAVLYAWAVARGRRLGSAAEWRGATLAGLLLISAAYGLVSWAEQRISSGLAALLVASVPAWMLILERVTGEGERPAPLAIAGVVLGFVGQYILLRPELARGASGDLLAAGAVLLSNVAWAVGSLASRRVKLPDSPLLNTAMQMLAGGAVLVALGLAVGEGPRVAGGAVSARSIAAWAYLVVAGSMLAYTAYVWLLGVTTTARVTTYAYVNPVVAVLVGWLVGGEAVGAHTVVATVVILAAVLMINLAPARGASR
ncbi:MAG TPA: EamA family transporter [Gemmatimonadaceae bacterium]|nr:EamA family transporter [Gemmatimonadaceae bacterium]